MIKYILFSIHMHIHMQLQEYKVKVILVYNLHFYNTLRCKYINEKVIIFWFWKCSRNSWKSTWPSSVISNLNILTTKGNKRQSRAQDSEGEHPRSRSARPQIENFPFLSSISIWVSFEENFSFFCILTLEWWATVPSR